MVFFTLNCLYFDHAFIKNCILGCICSCFVYISFTDLFDLLCFVGFFALMAVRPLVVGLGT